MSVVFLVAREIVFKTVFADMLPAQAPSMMSTYLASVLVAIRLTIL
jgi:hypothetical protein